MFHGQVSLENADLELSKNVFLSGRKEITFVCVCVAGKNSAIYFDNL